MDDHGLCARYLGLEKGRSGACFSHQVKKCRGACTGLEATALYNTRLKATLVATRLAEWPYPGPVGIREHHAAADRTDIHVVDRWCYLGTATHEGELAAILENRSAMNLERDTYRILTGYFRKNARPEVIDLSQASHEVCYAE